MHRGWGNVEEGRARLDLVELLPRRTNSRLRHQEFRGEDVRLALERAVGGVREVDGAT